MLARHSRLGILFALLMAQALSAQMLLLSWANAAAIATPQSLICNSSGNAEDGGFPFDAPEGHQHDCLALCASGTGAALPSGSGWELAQATGLGAIEAWPPLSVPAHATRPMSFAARAPPFERV